MQKGYTLLEGTPNVQSKITVGNTTTVILAASPKRKYAIICNDSNEAIYIKLGASAVMNEGIRLGVPGTGTDRYIIDTENLWKGSINGICASGSKVVTVLEF